MADFIREELTDHTIKMKNGNKPYPIKQFVELYNNVVGNLLKGSCDFYNQISTAFEETDDLSRFNALSDQFVDQRDLMVKLRGNDLPVYMPDYDYYLKAYTTITNTSDPSTKRALTKTLFQQLSTSLANSYTRNKENGLVLNRIK